MTVDWLSAIGGFLSGAIAGALANYWADRLTDRRRRRQAQREEDEVWADISHRFPSVIAEMKADYANPEHRAVRAFFLKTSSTLIANTSEPTFEYHTDKHPNVRAAVLMLEQHGYVSELPAGCPMYRVHEKLIDRLLPSRKRPRRL